MADQSRDDRRKRIIETLRQLIDELPQPDHATRVNALIMGVYEASGLRKDEFTQVLRAFASLLHQSPVELVIPGEEVCGYCDRSGVLNTAPDGEMACEKCMVILKTANLYRWRADEAGVPPIEVDDELRDILRRMFGYDATDYPYDTTEESQGRCIETYDKGEAMTSGPLLVVVHEKINGACRVTGDIEEAVEVAFNHRGECSVVVIDMQASRAEKRTIHKEADRDEIRRRINNGIQFSGTGIGGEPLQ